MVRKDGLLLRYVKVKCEDVYIAAINNNEDAIQYVDEISLNVAKMLRRYKVEIKVKKIW